MKIPNPLQGSSDRYVLCGLLNSPTDISLKLEHGIKTTHIILCFSYQVYQETVEFRRRTPVLQLAVISVKRTG